MGRKCEFFWCPNQEGNSVGKSFHAFPNSDELCRIWVARCGSAEAEKEYNKSGTQAFRRKKICSDHFSPESYRNVHCKDRGLLPGAVPLVQTLENLDLEEHANDGTHEFLEDDDDYLAWLRTTTHDEQQKAEASTNRPTKLRNISGDEQPSTEGSDQVSLGDFWSSDRQSTCGPEEPLIHSCAQYTFSSNTTDNESLLETQSFSCSNVQVAKHGSSFSGEEEELTNLSQPSNHRNRFIEPLEEDKSLNLQSDSVPQLPQTEETAISLASKALLNVEREKNKVLKSENLLLRRQLFVSKQTSRRRLNSNKKMKTKVSKTVAEMNKLRKQKSQNESLGENVRKNPVMYDIVVNSSKKPKARRYHQETLKFASSVYLSGPRTYRFIRRSKKIILPHKNSVYRYNKHIRIKPGLSEILLRAMEKKVKNIRSQKEKIVAISCDGMSIKSELTYSAKADIFYGFPDYGEDKKVERNRTTELATEAVCIMVSGMYRNFKQPIGYLLAHNCLNSKIQLKFIEDSVRAVRDCGLYPLVVTTDQCSTNTKMAREAGATPADPVIVVDNQELVLMFDSPHLTKSARNSVFKHNVFFNDSVASSRHIVKLYEVDMVSPLRLAPKLASKCIELPPFAAMNVALAVRTLSETCAIAMRHYVGTGELPVEALKTADFLELHDKLFDVFNSKEKYSSSIGKPYRTPITNNSNHFEFLDKMLTILQNMFYTTNTCTEPKRAKKESLNLKSIQRRPPYISGFIGNINALKWLWEKLKTEFGCTYLCTNPLCQDCLENFFAEIRRRCGFNDAPNAFQFGCAFKYAMISAAHQNFDDGKNCQTDDKKLLLSEAEIDQASVVVTDTPEFNYRFVPFEAQDTVEILKKELNALVYIVGAAVRKLPHEKCRSKLIAEKDDECMRNDDYDFCKLKSSLSQRKVTIPNNTLYNIGLLAFCAYKEKFRKFLYQNRRFVKRRLKMYVNYVSYDDATCKPCFDKLLDIIFNTLIQSFLRDVRVQNKIASNNRRKRSKRNRKAFRMNLPESR